MLNNSLVILNESIQSTTPSECLDIATIHLEIMSVVGVKGLYVTHLTGLYDEINRINSKSYHTKDGSLVSSTDEKTGERLYKMRVGKPPKESLAYDIYNKFGAKLSDIVNSNGDRNAKN